MTLTLTQAYHRTQDLGGLIKAGESALADCEADAEAKQRIASIAVEGVEKAKANLAALKQERSDLAEHMKALVEQVGEAADNRSLTEVVADLREIAKEGDWGPNALQELEEIRSDDSSNFADFGHPTQNGLDAGVNEALDRARSV